ncbi:hypothetical protein PGT21_014848 [Puccinia graminis f. sp. tritici]|uniref:Uncharacterized protein n=1 Tax=Puccinia graminis f. sp. tritici TaxID=56615 RepID=A0A5B0QF94_PUCGR|nr:hypothetical protein PGT21_014848 [Puccinia graminis f. sp. tritici]
MELDLVQTSAFYLQESSTPNFVTQTSNLPRFIAYPIEAVCFLEDLEELTDHHIGQWARCIGEDMIDL